VSAHALLALLTRVASSGHCIAAAPHRLPPPSLLDFALEKLAKRKRRKKIE
jgi:hypothetical protein